MNFLDVIIFAILVFLVALGVFRGLFRELGSLAGIVLGIYLANFIQPQLTRLLSSFLPSEKYLSFVCFVVIFAVVFVLCNLMSRGLKKLFGKAISGWANGLFGASLAFLKGVIIIYFGIWLLVIFVPSKAPLITKSKLAPWIITSGQSMASVIFPESPIAGKKRP
jgi:membrane protein required for colicin V production